MPRVEVDSVSLNYEFSGNGPVVVFVNGLTMSLNGWVQQVEAFGQRYSVLRYDCRGQGTSDKPEAAYSQEIHARDLKMLLDRLNIPKAHIVGLSNGGMIAQHFALMYPETTGALVLVDTCSHVDILLELIVKSWIKATESGGNGLRYDVALPTIFSENFISKNLDTIMALRELSIEMNTPEAVINLSNASIGHDLRDRVSEIVSPTLIVFGEEDILIPFKYSKELNEKIKGSKLVVMKECGHASPLEKPDEFNTLAMDFLKDHDKLLQTMV